MLEPLWPAMGGAMSGGDDQTYRRRTISLPLQTTESLSFAVTHTQHLLGLLMAFVSTPLSMNLFSSTPCSLSASTDGLMCTVSSPPLHVLASQGFLAFICFHIHIHCYYGPRTSISLYQHIIMHKVRVSQVNNTEQTTGMSRTKVEK